MEFTSEQQACRKEMRKQATIVSHGNHRVIRRCGSVVTFEPSKLSTEMARAFLAVANAYRVKREPASFRTASVPVDDGGDTSGTSPGAGAGADGGGDGDDDDGDGDGDGDGPRQTRSDFPIRRTRNSPAFPSVSQSKPIPVTPASSPHRDALVALVFLTTVVLSTSVALAMLGFPALSASVIATLTGLPSLAAKFIRPK